MNMRPFGSLTAQKVEATVEWQWPQPGYVSVATRLGQETQAGWNTFNETGDSVTSVADWLRITYPDGMIGGIGAGDIFPDPEDINVLSMWVRYIVRLSTSPSYYGHPGNTNKLVFIRFGDGSGGNMYLGADGAGNDSLFFGLHTQGTTSHPGGVNYSTPAECVRGQTYVCDIFASANTSGNADGRIRLVVDGVEQAFSSDPPANNDADDIQWNELTPNVYGTSISPIWGGAGSEIGQEGPPAIPADIYIEQNFFDITVPE